LQLGFEDDPYYLGLDDISLKPIAAAAIKTTARTENNFHLTWNTSTGSIYQLQYKTNLFQPDWINLGPPTTAPASALSLTDTNAFRTAPQRYYRLLLLP
jgi:hypothetical protein